MSTDELTRRRLGAAAAIAVVAFGTAGVAATFALAATPNKGAVYVGANRAFSRGILFEVSPSGKSLTHFQGVSFDVPFCGVPASPQWPTHATIKNHRFAFREIVPNNPKAGAMITGRFTAGGGVKGTLSITEKCPSPTNPTGPGVITKHRTASWSGISEPQGKRSRYCLPAGNGPNTFLNIIELRTTCTTVDKALKAGTFTVAGTPPNTYRQFSTPGWTCMHNTNKGTDTCTKATASFSFSQGA